MNINLSNTAFWDVDFKNLDETKHADFIIARVFQYGLLDDLKNILKYYSAEQIKQGLLSYRGLDKNAAALAKVLGYLPE